MMNRKWPDVIVICSADPGVHERITSVDFCSLKKHNTGRICVLCARGGLRSQVISYGDLHVP